MFGFLINAFDVVLYQPLFNFLVLLYNYIPGHDFGIAVIVLTLIIRLILYPSTVKTIKTQKALNEIQPQIQEINKKYKDDKEKQVKETLDLYKKSNVSPFGSLLPTIIQIPLLIALYRVFWKGFQAAELTRLYSFVYNPGLLNPTFIGLIDLSKPNIVLAVIAGILQFWQTKSMVPKTKKGEKINDFTRVMQKQMVYFYPVLTVIILMGLPSALGLYWAVGSLFMIAQQYVINKKHG